MLEIAEFIIVFISDAFAHSKGINRCRDVDVDLDVIKIMYAGLALVRLSDQSNLRT